MGEVEFEELMLMDNDFPNNYVKVATRTIQNHDGEPQFIAHSERGAH